MFNKNGITLKNYWKSNIQKNITKKKQTLIQKNNFFTAEQQLKKKDQENFDLTS